MGFIDDAKENIAEGFEKAKDAVGDAAEVVKDKAEDATEFVKDKLGGDEPAATAPASTEPTTPTA